MIDWKRIRVLPERLVTGLTMLALGAWLMVKYIDYAKPELAMQLRHIESGAQVTFLLLNFANLFVRQPIKADVQEWSDASVAWSGAGVILLTGFAGAFWIVKYATGGGNMDAAIIVFVTLLAASAVWRWAKANAANIGEARFDTSHNPS